MLPNLGVACLALAIAWAVGRLVSSLVARSLAHVSHNQTLVNLVARLVRFLIYGIGFIVALQILNLDKAATTFLAGAGVVGLALGFAFQDLSANFISGVGLALRRPMQPGDIVETNGHTGVVKAIELRTTTLYTFQGQTVRVPNRKIYEESLVNYSELKRRRVDVTVGVSYGDDLEKVRRVTLDAISQGVEFLEGTNVDLYFTEFADSSINFTVRFWVKFAQQIDFLDKQSAAIMAIKAAFDANDITIPFPIRTLDFGIKGGEKLQQQLAERV